MEGDVLKKIISRNITLFIFLFFIFATNVNAADNFLLKNKAVTYKETNAYSECSEESELKFVLDKNKIVSVY